MDVVGNKSNVSNIVIVKIDRMFFVVVYKGNLGLYVLG